MERMLAALGAKARGPLVHVGRLTRLTGRLAGVAAGARRLNLRLLARICSRQVFFTGVQAAPLVAILAASIGAVGIMEFVALLTGLADELIGKLLVTIVVREMGPLITAVVVIARSGTAMAAEIGTMQLDGELEALSAYRIDPVAFVLLPRVVSTVVSLFALILLFDLSGLLGGAAIAAAVRGLSFALVSSKVELALTNLDLGLSALKALLFGSVIAVVSCYWGMLVRRSPTELPQAVTRAVVVSLGAVFLVDAALAMVFIL